MKTVNSLSGGKTSSYLAANYTADYNVFALVRTSDTECMFPDEKVRQMVSDKLGGAEFIGTLEDDMIIYTMLELEQFIGQEIMWVTGKTFDEIISKKGKDGGVFLPNLFRRFCTSEMKMQPIFDWWVDTFDDPVEMRIGYRANEGRRVKKTLEQLTENGLSTFKAIVGKRNDGKNKWGEVEWRKPVFPLFDNRIFKDHIEEYWKNKPVRFGYTNNCIGCFHRNEMMLKLMSEKYPNKFDWFIRQEKISYTRKQQTFKNGITYQQIKDFPLQANLDFDDFSECDSGHCGI